jgi:hypothetical protein
MFYADKWVTAQGEDSLDEVHVGAEDDAFFAKGVEVVAAVFRRRPTLAK